MTPVFADTYFFIALFNAKDGVHQTAVDFSEQQAAPLVTTAWVLTEFADGIARSSKRESFAQLMADLENDPNSTVVPLSQELFSRGVNLYNSRPDKEWSLTDCISFVVMDEQGIREALTGDHHFEQAGFTMLLK